MTTLALPNNSVMHSKDFIYGVATASFQIEGGIEDRLPCIWDTFCATEGKIADQSNGTIACDHYHLWQQDVELITSLNVDAYRLSISWPRVITLEGKLNPTGVDFYQQLIDALVAKGIKVFVTLYHWDLPQHIEDNGGWLNRETAYLFADYVNLISQALGEKVHSYATFNEPFCTTYLGYEIGIHAPGKVGKEYGRKAAHHLLLAHGLAMQVLQKNCPNALNGIVLNFTPAYSATDKPEDIAATQFADDYFNQWYIKPLFDKTYPEILSMLPTEHQPDIQPGDMEIIAQPLDFLGVNFYTRAIYQAHDEEIFEQLPAPEPTTDIGWEIYPSAFTYLLTDLNHRYALPPVFITENGMANNDEIIDGKINDQARIDYYQSHLSAVNDAIEQGVNVVGYFAWSLMDNFEWAEGYLKRFGLVHVDYQSQKRTIKQSGLAYKQLISRQ